jgi:predicted nuclease of predicted toxin-antitoxin system
VAGLGIRLFTDEHISGRLARALRSHGYDAESCHEAGRADQGIPDEDHLDYASRSGRAILTFNHVDFVRIDAAWKRGGQQHAGIVLSPEVQDIGELLRRVERYLNTYPTDVQHDTLLWLDSSPTR